MFTQPLMYKKIAEKENVLKIYEDRLLKDGIPLKEIDEVKNRIKGLLDQYYQDAVNDKFDKNEWVPEQWENLSVKKYSVPQDTGINEKKLRELGERITTVPSSFNAHPQIRKIYEQRLNSIKEGKGIDWATAEALAWAYLLEEGYTVRLSGQDVERGTFSHRHSVLHDQVDGSKYIPIQKTTKYPNNFQVHNSHLSEFAVLGFELGFSYYNPDALVMWEAQFGDFVNGAQIIIDQFIAPGEAKWNVQSGLVLLLPHGMDGQGPEHSSCRIERFLDLMDDDYRNVPNINETVVFQIQHSNLQVCNPTTAANYFHVLIRQLKRQFRKPLIIPSPKKLLRFKNATSTIEEFKENLRYTKVRNESNQDVIKNAKKVKKILFCSGQVYYDLLARREKLGRKVN
jgi:2-oxoglutarate dehydrogenase E1 component